MIVYEGSKKNYICDFCQTNNESPEVKKMLSGFRNTHICNNCIDTAVDTLSKLGIEVKDVHKV